MEASSRCESKARRIASGQRLDHNWDLALPHPLLPFKPSLARGRYVTRFVLSATEVIIEEEALIKNRELENGARLTHVSSHRQ